METFLLHVAIFVIGFVIGALVTRNSSTRKVERIVQDAIDKVEVKIDKLHTKVNEIKNAPVFPISSAPAILT